MAIITQPTFLAGEWAYGGDKNIIPDTNDGLAGLASIEKGFPPITQQPLASGGLPPQRADFNGIFNMFSKFLLFAQAGGNFAYSPLLDYDVMAMVRHNGVFYVCAEQNGPNVAAGVQEPAVGSQYWTEYADLATPVGDVIYRPYLKAGYVKANGATVNRSDYPNLVAFADANNLWTTDPTGNPWKYGVGNGSSTMVLPDYRNRVIQGGDSTAILQPGLPDINGSVWNRAGKDSVESGVFKYEATSLKGAESSGTVNGSGMLSFRASWCNSIYGNSKSVQPPAIQLVPQLKY